MSARPLGSAGLRFAAVRSRPMRSWRFGALCRGQRACRWWSPSSAGRDTCQAVRWLPRSQVCAGRARSGVTAAKELRRSCLRARAARVPSGVRWRSTGRLHGAGSHARVDRRWCSSRRWGLATQAEDANGSGPRAPMAARVAQVCCNVGQEVAAGALLFVLEAMKMELRVVAAAAGTLVAVNVQIGDQVVAQQLLAELEQK